MPAGYPDLKLLGNQVGEECEIGPEDLESCRFRSPFGIDQRENDKKEWCREPGRGP